MPLLKGQKVDVTKGRSLGKLAVQFGWKAGKSELGMEAGDQEVIELVLGYLPEQNSKAAFTVTIYDGEQLGHAFQDVTGLYVRLVNLDTGGRAAAL